LRSVLGEVSLDNLLSRQETLNIKLRTSSTNTPIPGGLKSLWLRLSRLICHRRFSGRGQTNGSWARKTSQDHHADGEFQAADKLAQAAAVISRGAGGASTPLSPDFDRDRCVKKHHTCFPDSYRHSGSVSKVVKRLLKLWVRLASIYHLRDPTSGKPLWIAFQTQCVRSLVRKRCLKSWRVGQLGRAEAVDDEAVEVAAPLRQTWDHDPFSAIFLCKSNAFSAYRDRFLLQYPAYGFTGSEEYLLSAASEE